MRALLLLAALSAPVGAETRAALAAVDAEAFAKLSGRRVSENGELWERLRAMGVSAALLREESLERLSARGEVLHFSQAEIEKWRAAGLVSPGSALKGETLWASDAKELNRAAAALGAAGIDVATVAVSGMKALKLPAGVDLSAVPAGFDPKEVAAVSSAGLLPVPVPGAASVVVAGHKLWVRGVPVDARPGEVLRAAMSRPLRLIVFRPKPELGLEANIGHLRESLRVLRASELPATLPETPAAAAAGGGGRVALIWILGLLGPLVAARAALQASRALRSPVRKRIEPASPVPQVIAGLAAAWLAAAVVGLLVAWLAPQGWRDGSQRAWTLWTWCAPAAVGFAALFPSRKKSPGWAAPVRRRDLATLAAFGVAAALLFFPRASLRASGVWEAFDQISASGALWWWPWRWREALLGAPALAAALALIERRDGGCCGAPAVLLADPRGWLLPGLLAPAGLIAAVGGSGVPPASALAHGAASFALGGLIGAGLLVLRGLLERWAQGPSDDRTIDLDDGS